MRQTQKTTVAALVMLGLCGIVSTASAVSLKSANGTVFLGVDTLGQLNAPDTYGHAPNTGGVLGLSRPVLGDATAPGCICEGWGVSVNGSDSVYANNAIGIGGVGSSSLTSDDIGAGAGTFATSVVTMAGASIEVTQAYTQAAVGNAFLNTVTIKNTGAVAVTDVKYVRVMDWDIPPTEFRDVVTIIGTATTTTLEESDNNGFNTADPLAGVSSFGLNNVDFVDAGPTDHGAYFRFNFGGLGAGESKSFNMYYGAAPNNAAADADLAAIAPELYSKGKSSIGGGPNNDSNVYYFAFGKVGGIIVTPGVPDAGGSLALLGLGLASFGGMSRILRRKA